MQKLQAETGVPSVHHVHVSWRAIAAGILVALATQVLLTLLGMAVGLSAFEPTGGAVKAVSIGLGIWLILTAVASVFAGSYFGARVAGDSWKADGAAHGLVTWAAFVLLSVWMVGAGVSSIGRLVGGAAGLAGQAASTATGTDARARAIQTLTALGYSRAEAEKMVADAGKSVRQAPGALPSQPEAREAAETAASAGAATSWVTFGVALLSLLGGVAGGVLGAIGEQKQFGRTLRAREPEVAEGHSS